MRSGAMSSAWAELTGGALSGRPLLLCGESGSGLGWLAEKVHESSNRARHACVAVHLGSLSKPQMPLALADGSSKSRAGTLVVRAIEELDWQEQERLLEEPAEQALVATFYTNGNRRPDGVLNSALLKSLTIIDIPPLRARREDIVDLASIFWHACALAHGEEAPALPVSVVTSRSSYDWPGNVSELRSHIVLEYERRKMHS